MHPVVEQITLPAPPLEFSMEPGEEQPFSQYSIQVDAEGFRPFTVSGIELFSEQLSLQEVRMDEVDAPGNPVDTIVIPVNTLWGDFPPKIARVRDQADLRDRRDRPKQSRCTGICRGT